MSLQIIKSSDAIENAKNFTLSRYPHPKYDQERLSPIALPVSKPSFTINKTDKIFTIGSCFARNVERQFHSLGFDIPTRAWLEYKKTDVSVPAEYLNKYVINSVYNELKWALDPATPFPGKSVLIEVKKDKWFDPHSTTVVRPAALEVVLKRRDVVREITTEIKKSKIIIITLGLVEAWYDRELGIYLNAPPPRGVIKADDDKYELHILSYQQILDELNKIHSLLNEYCMPDWKMLITVSPVPLALTYTKNDILQANSYSKSVLRAAVEAFHLNHQNVDYYPSYESITLSERRTAWGDDNRHVLDNIVGVNITKVAMAYAETDDDTQASYYYHLARVYELDEKIEQAIKYYELSLETSPSNQAYLSYGMLLIEEARNEDAIIILDKADKSHKNVPYWLGQAMFRLNKHEEAIDLFELAFDQNRNWAGPLFFQAQNYIILGKIDAARKKLQQALEILPTFKEAITLLQTLE